jgi:hypothetical protein
MTRYLILVPLIACAVSSASAQSVRNQPDASSVRQGTPQQTVIGDYLSLGIDGRRGHEFLFGYTGMPVYTYSRDKGAQATCYDECAVRSETRCGRKNRNHKALGREPTAHVQRPSALFLCSG